MEKLKGFTCSAEPSVGRSDTQREEKETGGASSKICDQGSSVCPPQDITDQHRVKNRLQKTEEEQEDEEDEEEETVKEKGSSGLTATKQVHNVNVDSITSLPTEDIFGQQVSPLMKV